LTSDGVHLNNEGNKLIADEMIKFLNWIYYSFEEDVWSEIMYHWFLTFIQFKVKYP
jgi:hypothetical protein